MTLELSKLTAQVQAMGQELAAREQEHAGLVALANRWLAQYADRGEALRDAARNAHAAIPTDEPLNATYPLPAPPERFTFIATDGTEIQPDSHEVAYYYLINVGSMVYRHGSGQAPEAHSQPIVGYTEDAIYDDGQLVSGNLLDIKRDLAEITALADLCTAEPSDTCTVAIVDGTLLMWTLRDTAREYQYRKAQAYLHQLDRIRDTDAVVAAFISRPRRSEIARLLCLAHASEDGEGAGGDEGPTHGLERLPDYAIFESLPAGARSALFVSPAPINHEHYAPVHTIHFFYLNLAEEGRDPAIARIEAPAWVAKDPAKLTLVHGAVVAQARITGDYPYALVRADELAFISGPEREAFEDMIMSSLIRAGVPTAPSPKKYYKTLTRRGKRKYR